MPEESSNGSGVSAAPSTGGTTSAPSSREAGSPRQAAQAQRILSTPEHGEGAGSQGPGVAGETPQQKQQRESRYARTRRAKQEFRAREAALAQREAQIAQVERAKNAPKKPDYTVEQLKEYRENWAAEGKDDLVQQADKEISRLEALEKQETSVQRFTQEWHQAEADLAQSDPEFMRNGTRLDGKLREIMQGPDGQIYRQHPRGIVAAYHRAKMEILEGDHKIALGKIKELETELERVTGLTSIGGGAPSHPSSGGRVENLKDFQKLTTKDMRKRLTSSRQPLGAFPLL